MGKRSLLDITQDMEALDGMMADLDAALVRTEGEVTPEVQAILDAIDAWAAELDKDFERKVDNYVALVKVLEGRAEVRKAEADRLAKRARIDAGNAAFLKDRLLNVFEFRNVKKVETDRYRVTVAANGGKVPLVLSDGAAENLVKQDRFAKVVRTLNTEAVREALEAGEKIGGASFGERGKHLLVR